tara:strand:- start:2262 stop:3248 length:987 start_codon:yes stop_codon:yes gene_type:complete
MTAELIGISFSVTLIFFSISIAVVVFSADKFIDYSSILAGRLGVSEFIIGLTLIAFGTSIPEIFVGVQAVQNQAENLAVSAIIGSNISNIALIFGIACIGRSLIPEKNATRLRLYIPLILSVVLLIYALTDLKIDKFDSLLIIMILPVFIYCVYTDKNIGVINKNDISSMSNFMLAAGLILMTVLLFYAAEGVVITGLDIASRLGISSTIVGLILIAIGTSLPELAATVAAIFKKKTDLVVGNVIGSNILNIALVIPIIGFFSTSSEKLDNVLLSRDMFVVSIATILFALFIFLQNKKPFKNLKVIKFGGFLFVLGYLVYILFLSKIL